jgi:hypothetical protein
MSPVLAAAQQYAELGYRVFPCQHHTKKPATEHGCKDATGTVSQLQDWFANPGFNVAIATDGILVIDLDDAEHPWAAREWPSGPVARTPRGGWHRYFKKPEGFLVQNWNGKLASAVDLKTDGGYVLTAPSQVVEPAKGIDGRYSWAEPLVSRQELPEAPSWFLEELGRYCASKANSSPTPPTPRASTPNASGSVIERARKYLTRTDPAISGQRGHDAALWAARVLVRGFMLSDADAWPLLAEWNQTCSPPWSDKELQHKLVEARQKSFAKPDGWLLNMDRERSHSVAKPTLGKPVVKMIPLPEYKPFPVELLPPMMQELVRNQASAKDCDPAFVALPALSLVAAAIGNSMAVHAKHGFSQPPILWMVTVGDSGTGKSPGMAVCSKIVADIEAQAIREFRCEMARYTEALARSHEAQEEVIEGEATAPPAPPPEKPKREFFLIDDATIERIAEDLQTSPRGMLLVNDELANWFYSFTRYKGGSGGDDSAKWLSCYEASSLSVRRRTPSAIAPREIFVKRATIGLFGGIQPVILAECFRNQKFVESGLAARLLFAYPPKRCPRFTDVEADPQIESEFADIVNKLRELPCSNESDPAPIHLESGAVDIFKQFHNNGSAEAEGLDGGPMSAVIPRLNRIVLRLALTLFAFEKAASGESPFTCGIDVNTMERAAKLASWFKDEAERVYAMLAEQPEDRSLRQLADLVRRKGGRMTVRDLQKSSGRRYPTVQSAELALDALVSAGLGEWSEEVASNSRTVRWLVLKACPTLSDTAEQEGPDGEPLSDTAFRPNSETLEKAVNEVQCRTVSASDTGTQSE